MKALTLWQPWASLVALGVKTIETRSWSTSYRGPLAIHAAVSIPHLRRGRTIDVGAYEVTNDTPMGCANQPQYLMRGAISWPYRLPLGAVVATCELIDVVPIYDGCTGGPGIPKPAGQSFIAECDHDGELPHQLGGIWLIGQNRWSDNPLRIEDQRPYGDFSPGRFAWLLADIRRIDVPVPAKGRQGLWQWEVPA